MTSDPNSPSRCFIPSRNTEQDGMEKAKEMAEMLIEQEMLRRKLEKPEAVKNYREQKLLSEQLAEQNAQAEADATAERLRQMQRQSHQLVGKLEENGLSRKQRIA